MDDPVASTGGRLGNGTRPSPPTLEQPLLYHHCHQGREPGGFSLNTHRAQIHGGGGSCVSKYLPRLFAAVALMGAAGVAASATNRSSHATTAQTTTTTQPTTTKLEPAAGLVGDDAGTCALLRRGAVECWGNNTAGTLGDGTLTSIWYSAVPVAVKGLTGARSLVSDGVGYSRY